MKATGVKSLSRVERHALPDRRVDREGRRDQQQRVTVRRRGGHRRAADDTARAGTVFDDHRLAPYLGKLPADGAADDVVRTPDRERNDQRDLPGRIGLRARHRAREYKRCGKEGSDLDHDTIIPAQAVDSGLTLFGSGSYARLICPTSRSAAVEGGRGAGAKPLRPQLIPIFRNNACAPTQISCICPPSRPTEGRCATSRNAGRDAVDAGSTHLTSVPMRTAKSCGSGAPTLALRSQGMSLRTTVAKKPGHRGEHEGSR